MVKASQIKDDNKKGIQQTLNLSIEERMAFIANLIIDKLELESLANKASYDDNDEVGNGTK